LGHVQVVKRSGIVMSVVERMFGEGDLIGVTPDVLCLQDRIANLYLYGRQNAGDREWVLIDAGVFGAAERIRHAAGKRFAPNARPACIILTHAHFDHVGAVVELAREWNCEVFVHPLEYPFVTGQQEYPPPDPSVGGGAMARLSFMYPRTPIQLGFRAKMLPADGSVPGMPGWRWIHVPGHSPGQVALFRDADRTLIAGDAFVTLKQESLLSVLKQTPEVRRPPAYFTINWDQAHRSVQTLADLRPERAATGHGVPMAGRQLRIELDVLADYFDQIAVPVRGHYVQQPV
jgi:glyoxylase-like metal-dependent hydrolase (beta-lactamase superfamily II)